MAAKFGYYTTDKEYLNQYMILLDTILNKNHSIIDLCPQLDSFVADTLLVQASEAKRLFKEVNFTFQKFNRLSVFFNNRVKFLKKKA